MFRDQKLSFHFVTLNCLINLGSLQINYHLTKTFIKSFFQKGKKLIRLKQATGVVKLLYGEQQKQWRFQNFALTISY